MTIRHIKVFIKVCEHGSVSKAAEELCIAQPSVSQTIKELESYYNVVLFNRVNHKLQLTHEGELLLQEAKDVIREFDQFETLAKNEDLNPIIKIGGTMSFGVFVIPTLNKILRKEIPGVDPRFFIDKPAGIEEKIHLGDLDFALCEGVINSKMLKSTCVGEDELIAICSIDFDAPEKIKLQDLGKYNLLLRERGNPSRRILD
ncbi:MAG: LysR family transcriptional regulator, partial [Bacilli bacterium]|nr:LysR family transcriptional regulator [Bacilli bacterium]